MAEQGQMVRLRKAQGGSSLTYEGHEYSWGKDGAVTEVPYALALSLLAIGDGGYSVEGDDVPAQGLVSVSGTVQSAHDAGLGDSAEGAKGEPGSEDSEDEDHEVTEPAPAAKAEVTEPAPPAGSPVTPRPRGGTRSAAPKK